MNRAIIYYALFLLLLQFSFAQLSDLDTRCLWIVRDSMYNEKMINSALVYAYQSGYNIVFIQVRGRGYSFYNSDIVPKHPKVESEFDPLAYAVTLGHALGIEVHVWVNSYILWSSKTAPKDTKHLYHTHKEWTEADRNLKRDSNIKLSEPHSPQWEGIYLSPIHPEVNPYLTSVYSEIINKYDIDGIHLDYIRYHDDYYGFHRDGRKEFDLLFNVDPLDISRGIISTRYGWEQDYVDSINIEWNNFKQGKVTELLEFINEDIKFLDRDIDISAAVKPNLEEAKYRWHQNWQDWLERGLVDFVIPMNYSSELITFMTNMKMMKDNIDEDSIRKIIMGISVYNQNSESVVDKIFLSRLNEFSGVSIFSYNVHKNNLEWFDPILKSLQEP